MPRVRTEIPTWLGTGMQAEKVGSADSSHPGSVTLGQARPPCSSSITGSKAGQAEPKDRQLGQGSAPKYQPWGRSISTHQAFHGCVHPLQTREVAGAGLGCAGVEASPHLCLGSFLSSPASRDLASGLSVRGKRISSMRMRARRRRDPGCRRAGGHTSSTFPLTTPAPTSPLPGRSPLSSST